MCSLVKLWSLEKGKNHVIGKLIYAVPVPLTETNLANKDYDNYIKLVNPNSGGLFRGFFWGGGGITPLSKTDVSIFLQKNSIFWQK